jgi:hypothetical protein
MQSQTHRIADQGLSNITLHSIHGGSRNLSPSEFSKLALEARRLRHERLRRAAGDANAQVSMLAKGTLMLTVVAIGIVCRTILGS